ncbi:MAG: hypothetical protein ACYDCG_02685 [Candidatus Acidiferrales bacterium]
MSAMAFYEMPAENPYQGPFRIFVWVTVVPLLVILFVAVWTPVGLSDDSRKILGWVAGAIVVAAVVIGNRLAFKQSLWKLKEGYRVEVSDGKIIQSRHGSPVVEIPVDQIASLRYGRGRWLIVRGCQPERQMAVPLEIVGFESLKREISENRTVSPLKAELSPWLFLPSATFVLACLFLFTSHNRVVIVAAGSAAILLQGMAGMAFFSLRHRMPFNRKAILIVLTYILTVLVLTWIVYQRATAQF